jgi:threonyl-tRNA synthetase
MLIVGDREVKGGGVNVRIRGEKVLGDMSLEKFVKLVSQDIEKKRQV